MTAAVQSIKQYDHHRWGDIEDDGAKTFRLHAGQSDVMRATARFKAAIAGTGGGKTALGPVWMMEQIHRVMLERDTELFPIMGMVVAPTYQIMARATAPTLVEIFKGTDLEGRYVESKNRYYLPHGLGIIWLLSADRPTALEGGQFDFAWVDEGGQLSLDAWIAIQGRVGQKQAPVLITTTPYGMNFLYHKIYKPWLAGDKDYYVRQWPSNMNPAYSDEEYHRAKGSMSAQRAAMRYDGQFIKMMGLVYPDLDSCIVDPVDPPIGRLVGGVDFGWNNPFASLGGTLYIDDDGKDVLYIWYERYKRETGLGDHAAAMLPIASAPADDPDDPDQAPRTMMWYADPSRPDSISELRRGGLKVRKAKNDIMLGIDAVNARIYTQRLKVSRSCKALIAESEEYAFPEKDDETYGEKPVDEFNHALDALRYLVVGLDRRKLAKQKKEAA